MSQSSLRDQPDILIGIEGGGTRTRVALARLDGRVERMFDLGPGNVRLLSDHALSRLLRGVRRESGRPLAIGIGMAGARTAVDQSRVRAMAQSVWPGVPCRVTHDLETALRAGAGLPFQPARRSADPRVLVLSGTGSCCYGVSNNGKTAKIGGWGHILGDKGSAYEVGLRGLKAALFYADRDGLWPALGSRLLRALQLNEPDQLIPWAQQAGKEDVAALAREVFAAAADRDRIARDILEGTAASLAKDALLCADRIASNRVPVEFLLAGGMFRHNPSLVRAVTGLIRRPRANARVRVLEQDSVLGALQLARQTWEESRKTRTSSVPSRRHVKQPARPRDGDLSALGIDSLRRSPTERRHPRSGNLDRMPLEQAVTLMLREDRRIPERLLAHRRDLARGVDLIARRIRAGGRLFYVGAGTSGRLGVLDASECPPTFGTDPRQVQGIIAGGQRALWESVEGAEDDFAAGARALAHRHAGKRDVIVGIAASGRTPFVWGALREAQQRGAATVLLTFNPRLKIPRGWKPSLVLAMDLGPEILTGSTRLKAGTATKLVLNVFTTLAMARTGKVLGNLMVDVKATNSKLRDRAIRLVSALTGASNQTSRQALQTHRWNVRRTALALGLRGR